MTNNKQITVNCIGGISYTFIGQYFREKQKEHWHYYKDTNGVTYHFRKEHIISVAEKEIQG